ncbi:MAG: glycosyltransferase [Bacteroidales bacterium]|nr:glycosyltransferase [Bacteroidales bacterium]
MFSNPKILIINNGLAGGGIERASVSLANYWAEKGIDVTVLALYQSEHFYTLNPKIKFIEPGFGRSKNYLVVYVIKMMLFARKYIKQIQPDTILAFSEWTNPYMVVANMGLLYRLFLTDRMNPLARLPYLSELLRRKYYKKATGIIAQSSFAKDILFEKTKAKNIKVIHNPVNIINKVDCAPKKRIVTVGRLSPEKGHRFLIEAFADLKNNEWELSIVGDGKKMENLKKLATELKVDKRVVFHGHLKDFSFQLSEAQIFVLPSLKEGFPNALLEAMSVSMACITTDFFQGNNEIIENGVNGLIVKPGDAKELTHAMELLINDESLRNKLSKNAFKVHEEYSFDKIANQYLNFILKEYV